MRSRRIESPGRIARLVPWLVGAAFLIAVALVVTAFRLVTPDVTLDLDVEGRLLVMPVRNATGEREHEWVRLGMMEMIAETLRRTPGVHVVAPDRLVEIVDARGLDPDDREMRRRVRELGLALGADAWLDVVAAKRTARGTPDARLYALRFEVTSRAGGELGSGELEGGDPARLAERLSLLVASALAGRDEPVTLAQVFSPSPFTNRLYGMGVSELLARGRAGADTARGYFRVALDVEPSFLAARYRVAECERVAGRLEASRRGFLELVQEAQDRGERVWEARALQGLAVTEAYAGRTGEAAQLTAQVRSLAAVRDDPALRLAALHDLARFSLTEGDDERSTQLFAELAELQAELGDRLGRVETGAQLGALALRRDDLEAAVRELNEARAMAAELGDVRSEMQLLASLGEVAFRRGQRGDAVELWRRVATFYEQRGNDERRRILLRNIAEALLLDDQLDEAEDAFHDVRELAVKSGDERLEALASLRLTFILLRRGYPYQARTYLDRAIELDRRLDQPLALQRMIAWMAYEDGNFKLALETLAAVKRQAGDAWNQVDQDFLEVFAQAVERGERLPVPGEDGTFGAR